MEKQITKYTVLQFEVRISYTNIIYDGNTFELDVKVQL